MNVLFVLGFPNPFAGAASTRIEFIAEAWSKRGHSVEMLGTFSYKTFRKRGKKRIDRVSIFNLIFHMDLWHPFVFTIDSIISFVVSAFFLLVRRPDVTIVSVPSGDVGLGGLFACELLKAKHLVDYRDEWEDYAIRQVNYRMGKLFFSLVKKLAASLYAKSQMVAAVTPNYMEALKQRGLTNVRLAPNGADIKTFKPLNNKSANETFTIFYSGGVGRYYRLDVAVKSIKKLLDKQLDVKLVIAGEGDVAEVLSLALKLGVSSNIEYTGAIDNKVKLARKIAEADIGLIPYDDNPLWKNSIPAKFFEYCACGVPVVATVYEDSIVAKLIKEHQIGLTVLPLDEEKLAEAIYQIYKNESFRETVGKRARALIEEKFDRNKSAEEYLDLLQLSTIGSDTPAKIN